MSDSFDYNAFCKLKDKLATDAAKIAELERDNAALRRYADAMLDYLEGRGIPAAEYENWKREHK